MPDQIWQVKQFNFHAARRQMVQVRQIALAAVSYQMMLGHAVGAVVKTGG